MIWNAMTMKFERNIDRYMYLWTLNKLGIPKSQCRFSQYQRINMSEVDLETLADEICAIFISAPLDIYGIVCKCSLL